MASSGYSISIRALDEASAQIKRINTALKDLQSQDAANDNQAEEGRRKQKRRFDELLSGIDTFGKQSKTALVEVGKLFDLTGTKISKTVDALAGSFKLGGLAVGAALGVKAVDALTSAMVKAGVAANGMRDAAANIFGRGFSGAEDRLQRFQALLGQYGIGPQASTDVLQNITTNMKLKAAQFQGTDLGRLASRLGIDVVKDPADVIFKKFVNAQMSGKFKEMGGAYPGASKQLFDMLGPGLTTILNRTDANKFWQDAEKASGAFTVQSEKTTTALGKVADESNKLTVQFTSLINAIENRFVGPLTSALEPLIGKLQALMKLGEENPGTTAAVAGAGGLGGLYLLKKAGERFLGWMGKSLGLVAQTVNPTEVAKGVGMLAWLGRLNLFGIGAGLAAGAQVDRNAGNDAEYERQRKNLGWFGRFLPSRAPGGGAGSKIIASADIPPIGSGDALARYATGSAVPGGPSPVTGVHPEFARRINAMVKAMPPEIARKFKIISGYRSTARQAEVNPSVTNSHHTKGIGADTTEDPEVLDWITKNGGRFGVGYTLADDPKERNHLEPTEGGQRVAPNDMNNWLQKYAPGTVGGGDRASWDNNMGNIRASANAWEGKLNPYKGFETFGTPFAGARAAALNVIAKAKMAQGAMLNSDPGSGTKQTALGQVSPRELALVNGPASDSNNPDYLAKEYAAALGIGVNDPIPLGDAGKMASLLKRIHTIEKGGQKLFPDDVYDKAAKAAIGPQSSNDSSHKVEVNFANAPVGMRSNIASSSGNSSLDLRTRYALGVV